MKASMTGLGPSLLLAKLPKITTACFYNIASNTDAKDSRPVTRPNGVHGRARLLEISGAQTIALSLHRLASAKDLLGGL